MTYKTRQEVLRAAADWMDVCDKAGVVAMCKYRGEPYALMDIHINSFPDRYEFPLALLEGKEVWVGSEVYIEDGRKLKVVGEKNSGDILILDAGNGYECFPHKNYVSWNQPKPKTVMVEMLVEDAEYLSSLSALTELGRISRAGRDCKKALENLK